MKDRSQALAGLRGRVPHDQHRQDPGPSDRTRLREDAASRDGSTATPLLRGRRRMEARLLRKLQPIRAQLKSGGGPSGFPPGSRTPTRPDPARLTHAVAASYSITRETCTLHTVTAHFNQDLARPCAPTVSSERPGGARGGDNHEARYSWAPRNRPSARRRRRHLGNGMRAGAGAVSSWRRRTLRTR